MVILVHFWDTTVFTAFPLFSTVLDTRSQPMLLEKTAKFSKIISKTAKMTNLPTFHENVTEEPDTCESGDFRGFS